MKWLLIYEFDVEIYRRAPTIRIYLKDTLLNEFTLYQRRSELIAFEYEAQPHNKLSIEFINDDNNFTNGFMTKFTSIIPQYMYLVPYGLIKNYDANSWRYENSFSKKNYYMYRKTGRDFIGDKYIKGLSKIKHYYRKRIVFPQNLFHIYDFFTTGEKFQDTPLKTGHKYGRGQTFNYYLIKKYSVMLYPTELKGFVILDYNSRNLFKKIQKNQNKYLHED